MHRVLMFVEAYVVIVVTQVGIRLLGLGNVITIVQRAFITRPRTGANEHLLLPIIAASYSSAARFYPARLECVPQALAIYCMARRRNYDIAFFIGVRKTPFLAHAWVHSPNQGHLGTLNPTVPSNLAPFIELL